ncbi:interleukin-18 receptor 1 isoform X2 [Rhinolophus ferrumequinum]|uniref:interleukin-18 receptor 1 isoform X2 n=1 Tax=Rhinolophus ferrumequinum TaxID=59479 RepID=UPI00140FD39A|nr:interleukin-18 receptor 1 isoform X2 [Rhinolophus ferrumequinum]
MHCGQLPLTFLVLIFVSTSETCSLLDNIFVLEGEHFYLKYCSLNDEHENETATIKWFKDTGSQGRVELSSNSSSRITFHDYVLDFWPVELDDSGSYFFQMGNTTFKWKLTVIKRNKHSCFSKNHVISLNVSVKHLLNVNCENHFSGKLVNRITWYKKNADFKDQGYYTCMFLFHHNGKLFNATVTHNVTVGDYNKITPTLLEPRVTTSVRVELGKDIQLNCSATGDEKDRIDWYIGNRSRNVHEEEQTKIKTPEGKWITSKILRIENVNEENLNFPYNCVVQSYSGYQDFKSFRLLKKEDLDDIPGHVFTRGMIAAVSISVVVVCLVIVGVIYRVDLALFYRHFMGRDETLTDGKTYDAFVSYLKECRPESGEEHTFAVETLPRVLEKHFGYKLCIFERDVVPGGAVVDEIHSLIEKSRRLIIVLSKSYMSNEVRYELESGLHEALVERKIKIILIEFTPVSDFTVLPQSLKLLKSHRVLKWKADKSLPHNSRFWKNLLYLMPAKTVKPYRDESEVLPCFHSPDL